MSAPRPSRTTPPRRRLVVVSALTAAVVVVGGIGWWWHGGQTTERSGDAPVSISEPGTVSTDAPAGLAPGGVASTGASAEPGATASTDSSPDGPASSLPTGATTTCSDAADGTVGSDDRCASASSSPLDPWWRRALPVDGTFVPIDGGVSGTVSITTLSDQLVIKVTDLAFATASGEGAELTVVLSSGDVIGERHGFWTVGGSSPIAVGTIPPGQTDITMILDVPSTLPSEVRSVVLLGGGGSGEATRFGGTEDVVGGAELLPSV